MLYADENSTQAQREKILKEWCRGQMREAIPPVLAECEALVGVRAKEWRIRDMRTRWGTCNTVQSRIYHFMDHFLPEWRAVRVAMREW